MPLTAPTDLRHTNATRAAVLTVRTAISTCLAMIVLIAVCMSLQPVIAVAANEVEQQATETAGGAAAFGKGPVQEWWGHSEAGLYGGFGGAFLGVFYGGVLSQFVARGRARTFVLGCYALLLPIGLVLAVAGIVAVMSSQPYAVYYPLLLLGLGCSGASIFGMTSIPRQYAEIELRAMAARDAGPA